MGKEVYLELPRNKILINVESNMLLSNNHYNYSTMTCKYVVMDIKLNELITVVDMTLIEIKKLFLQELNKNIDSNLLTNLFYEFGSLIYMFSRVHRYGTIVDNDYEELIISTIYNEIDNIVRYVKTDIIDLLLLSELTLDVDELLTNILDDYFHDVINTLNEDRYVDSVLNMYDIDDSTIINIIKKSIIRTNNNGLIVSMILIYK